MSLKVIRIGMFGLGRKSEMGGMSGRFRLTSSLKHHVELSAFLTHFQNIRFNRVVQCQLLR